MRILTLQPQTGAVYLQGLRGGVRVELVRDDVAGVFVATSPDLPGLVAEANTASELIQSVHDCADMLMDELVKVKAAPCVAWDGQAVMAAAGAALTPLPIA